MSSREKRVLQIWIILILVGNAIALAVATLLQNLWAVMIVLGVIAFDLYWFYVRYYQRKKPRYPLVPPEGKGDIYLPRTNIPRPIHEDARKMREKKRRLEKLKKWTRKIKRKKK